jgi:hypothetical protein
MDFAEVRRLFPGATQRVFLDAAAISLTSTRDNDELDVDRSKRVHGWLKSR